MNAGEDRGDMRARASRAALEMVDLGELSRLHRESAHPLRLEDVFGDGVLLSTLVPLARARELVLGLGYRFSPLETLPRVYDVLPLLTLPDILDRRTIPYRRNAAVLTELAAHEVAPIVDELTFSDISPLCLIHHETAHALYFETVGRGGPGLRPIGPTTGTKEARRLVEVLVESEGFALGLDIFVALLAKAASPRSIHQLASINSPPNWFPSDEDDRDLVARLVAVAGSHPAAVLKLLCAGTFIANLRPRASTRVSPALAERVCRFAGLPDFGPEAGELLSIALRVDRTFRERVAPSMFRYMGLEPEYRDVITKPLDDVLASGGSFCAHVSLLANALLDESQRPWPEREPTSGRQGRSPGGTTALSLETR